MPKQIISSGSAANDRTGDNLRNSAGKINANFNELYSVLGNGTQLSVAQVAKTGNYNDLSNKPTIPSDVSQLTDTTNLLSGTGGNTNTGSVTFTGTSIIGQTNSLILKSEPNNGWNDLYGIELFNSIDNDTHLRPLSRDKGIALGFAYGMGSHVRVEGYNGQGGIAGSGDRVGIFAMNNDTGVNSEWVFNNDGSTQFPTLNVDLHNGGIQTGRVLQFSDAGYQAIITGPKPLPGQSAQRLIIQGQRSDDGEGGDVYLWAGDSFGDGGDIKIYAGNGEASPSAGGYVNIQAGSGYALGGHVNIAAGYAANQGGDVNINSGGASQGTQGAIRLNAAGNSVWQFTSDAVLTLPRGNQIFENLNRLTIDGTNGDGYVEINGSASILIGYNSTPNVYLGNPNGGNEVAILGNKLRVMVDVPLHSYGKAGDEPNMFAMDSTALYFCTQLYVDDQTNIWKRIVWSGDTW